MRNFETRVSRRAVFSRSIIDLIFVMYGVCLVLRKRSTHVLFLRDDSLQGGIMVGNSTSRSKINICSIEFKTI